MILPLGINPSADGVVPYHTLPYPTIYSAGNLFITLLLPYLTVLSQPSQSTNPDSRPLSIAPPFLFLIVKNMGNITFQSHTSTSTDVSHKAPTRNLRREASKGAFPSSEETLLTTNSEDKIREEKRARYRTRSGEKSRWRKYMGRLKGLSKQRSTSSRTAFSASSDEDGIHYQKLSSDRQAESSWFHPLSLPDAPAPMPSSSQEMVVEI